jgi:GAF domain-containing protein
MNQEKLVEGRSEIQVPDETVQSWQQIADLLCGLANVPIALIMRLRDPHIEVFVASQGGANPYRPGSREEVWGSGLYCETVLKTGDKLLVRDALADPNWCDNPDIKLGMISYLGLPIRQPGGIPFGTLCVLDTRPNGYSKATEQLMEKLRDLIESHIGLIHMNQRLGDQNRSLEDYLRELQALRGIVPMCMNCKGIRDAQGQWHPLDHYLFRDDSARLSHGYCPQCTKKLFPDLGED